MFFFFFLLDRIFKNIRVRICIILFVNPTYAAELRKYGDAQRTETHEITSKPINNIRRHARHVEI